MRRTGLLQNDLYAGVLVWNRQRYVKDPRTGKRVSRPNPPEQWGPWRVPHRLLFHDVPCSICYSRVCPYGHECLRLVTPAMVLDAARDLLSGAEPAATNGATASVAQGGKRP